MSVSCNTILDNVTLLRVHCRRFTGRVVCIYVASFRASVRYLLGWFSLHKLFRKYVDLIRCSSRTNDRETTSNCRIAFSSLEFRPVVYSPFPLLFHHVIEIFVLCKRMLHKAVYRRRNKRGNFLSKKILRQLASVAKLRNWSRLAYTRLCFTIRQLNLIKVRLIFRLTFLFCFRKKSIKESAKS